MTEEFSHPFDNGSLDVFALDVATKGKPLQWVGKTLFAHLGLSRAFHIPQPVLERFLTKIESLYHPSNPYHNAMHASDVTWSMYYLLLKSNLLEILLPTEILSCIISAIIHDCDHPGKTNSFLINTFDPLAIRYNDQSVLENHHCYTAFSIMQDEECNILQGLTHTEYKYVRKMIIKLVLGTDFSAHTALMADIDKLVGRGWPMESFEDRSLLCLFTLKCADLGHGTKALPLHVQWSQRISEEFFLQGDVEKEKKMDVSKGMDRVTSSLAPSQADFLERALTPLFKIYCTRFTECHPLYDQIEQNLAHWQTSSR